MSAHLGKYTEELIKNAKAIATPGKGILAADESTGTIGKRFQAIGVENNEQNRRDYRELLFTAKEAHKYLSGVILYEETLFQKGACGKSMVDLLNEGNILPGIKVDVGTAELPGAHPGETTTLGLDGLGERCKKYYQAGARFAKWRAVLRIGANGDPPSALAIHENAHGLARYAIACQENGLVPIVEPEILSDGTHSIKTCAAVTERVLSAVYEALNEHNVLLEGTLLKPNMVTAGASCSTKPTPQQVAGFTLQALQRTVPVAVPGIMFLSGGQSEEDATLNLNAMNKMKCIRPWTLSFSYGRALQHSVLRAWSGQSAKVADAQRQLVTVCRANSDATLGRYSPPANLGVAAGSSESLYVKDYKY